MLIELPASRNGAGNCWTDYSVDADAAQLDPSLARFGMGLIRRIRRPLEGRSWALVEQGELSSAAWPLVRFTTDEN
jgi:hypothetical protein